MDWKVSIGLELKNTESSARGNPREISEKFEEALKKLEAIGRKLDQQILQGANVGIRHLVDGMNSDVPTVRTDEFLMARREFARLIDLDPTSSTIDHDSIVDNRHLICLGYWGSHYYFLLRHDQKSSAIQAYECAERFPNLALVLFSADFFSKPYLSLISEKGFQLAKAKSLFKSREHTNFWGKTKYYTKETGRLIASGSVALGGLVGGLFVGALGFPHVVMLLTAAGFRGANEVYESMRNDKPQLLDIDTPRNEVERLTKEISDLWREVVREGESRKKELQVVTLNNLTVTVT